MNKTKHITGSTIIKDKPPMANRTINQNTLVPIGVVLLVASAIAAFISVRADASDAKAQVTDVKQRVECLEREAAVTGERLKNIQALVEKIDRKLP